MQVSKVLIVDDSEADQFLAEIAIEEYDPEIEVAQAFDGKEALEMLDTMSQQPDIIFLDINMPVMNGHEFLKEYSKRPEQVAVVIMLTSSTNQEDRERSVAFRCVKDYFVKPLDEINLATVMTENLLKPK